MPYLLEYRPEFGAYIRMETVTGVTSVMIPAGPLGGYVWRTVLNIDDQEAAAQVADTVAAWERWDQAQQKRSVANKS